MINKVVGCSVKAYILKGGKFLLLHTLMPDGTMIYDLPGGTVEYGEDPYQTLHREVMEEICLEVKIEKSLGMHWFITHRQKKHVICHTFLCSIKGSGVIDLTKNPADENIVKYEWLTPEEFKAGGYAKHPSFTQLLDRITL